jgi:hypothetical protein
VTGQKRERSVIAKSGGLDDLTSWEVGRIRESDSTYDEIEVQVIRAQLLQGRLQISSNVFRSVRVVPELETKPWMVSHRQNEPLDRVLGPCH